MRKRGKEEKKGEKESKMSCVTSFDPSFLSVKRRSTPGSVSLVFFHQCSGKEYGREDIISTLPNSP